MYDAEIFFVDSQFGRVIEELKKLNLYDNTIIIVIGDHGEGLGDHDWWTHRLLYQEDIRVPLLIHVPQGPRNKTISRLVRNIDIYPTIMDMIGVESPLGVDGRSLMPIINGKADKPRVAYSDALNIYDHNSLFDCRRPKDALIYSVIDYPWKLIYHDAYPDEHELYNLDNDPHELTNLYDSKYEREIQHLIKTLMNYNSLQKTPFHSVEEIDPEVVERLQSLGYAGGNKINQKPIQEDESLEKEQSNSHK